MFFIVNRVTTAPLPLAINSVNIYSSLSTLSDRERDFYQYISLSHIGVEDTTLVNLNLPSEYVTVP